MLNPFLASIPLYSNILPIYYCFLYYKAKLYKKLNVYLQLFPITITLIIILFIIIILIVIERFG